MKLTFSLFIKQKKVQPDEAFFGQKDSEFIQSIAV